MNGKILNFDANSREGVISGDDGNRYRFIGPDWHDSSTPMSGLTVDFIADSYRAHSIRRVVIHVDNFQTLANLKGQSGRGCILPVISIATALVGTGGLVLKFAAT